MDSATLRQLAAVAAAGADTIDSMVGVLADREATIADLRRQLEEKPVPTAPVVSDMLGAVQLEQFRKPGGTWDDALDAALADIVERRRTSPVTPPLLFPTGQVDLQRGGRAWFDGLKFIYPFGHGNQQRAAESIPCSVRFSGKGPLWRFAQANVFDIGFEGVGWQGNTEADFVEASSTNVWSAAFGSAGFNLWRHVFGSPAQQFLTTASVFFGWWNTNNCYAQPYTFGGSDSAFTWDRHIIDVGGAATANRFPANGFLVNFAHQSKTEVSGLYLTCQGAVSGVKTSNSATGGRLVLRDPHIEGRNAGAPSTGTLLQVDSGVVVVENPTLQFGAKPLDRDEGAPVVINGGDVELIRPTHDRARGRAESVPFILQRGGVLNVARVKATANGGAWTGRPVIRRAGGVLLADDTVTVA